MSAHWQWLAPWMVPALDVAVVVLLGALLVRLRRDPTQVWREREAKLAEIYSALRLLVAQAEGEARDLDARLAEHEERLSSLLRAAHERTASERSGQERGGAERTASACAGRERAASPAGAAAAPEPTLAERVARLAQQRVPVEEIARRLALPLAEARLLVGLRDATGATGAAARAAEPGAAGWAVGAVAMQGAM